MQTECLHLHLLARIPLSGNNVEGNNYGYIC